MRKEFGKEPGLVNRVLFFYSDWIGSLDLFAYDYLMELIREFGAEGVDRKLRQAVSDGRTGESVLVEMDRALSAEWVEG
ncbi:hypothetical protein ACFFIY_03160 [Bhargavaea ullalensis]|uniref:Uncharacterized protein n=1 Tax=Bhargavaea ullalensis TaxID=1265685 RepID=A0ABV2GCT7_9BACL